MATKAIAGFSGKIYIGDTPTAVGEIRDATLTVEQAEIDATSFDSGGWVENIGGLKSWSLDGEALWVADDAGQTAVFDALTGGTLVTAVLYPKDAASQAGYSGSAIISSFEVGVPHDDAVTVSISLTGSGALTQVTKSAV